MTMGGNVKFIFPINMYLAGWRLRKEDSRRNTRHGKKELGDCNATDDDGHAEFDAVPEHQETMWALLCLLCTCTTLGHIKPHQQLRVLLPATCISWLLLLPSHPVLGQSNTHVSALFINRPKMMIMMGKAPPLVRPSCSSLAGHVSLYLPTTNHQPSETLFICRGDHH